MAAGHPETARAGAAILEDGGTAADAAVAMCLVSCVAETLMTGLLGGGHAIVWDGRRAALLDCFVTVPSGAAGPMDDVELHFGEQAVHYAVGPASCAVPGLPAGLGELWRALGRMPWAELVHPALALARSGVTLLRQHASALAMLEPVFTIGRGRELYAPGGKLLHEGDVLHQPGVVTALEALTEEGAASAYRGTIAEALLAEEGVPLTRGDLRTYVTRWRDPVETALAGTRVLTRGGYSRVPETIERLPRLAPLDPPARALALVEAIEAAGGAAGAHTTNLVAVDTAGRAVVLTTSLGLGSGDHLPGLDLHLNSMLGEKDLQPVGVPPGARVNSMMAPTLAVDAAGLALAIGSAGGTRLRSALVAVAAGVLDEGLGPEDAVARPRLHPAGGLVHAEGGVDDDVVAALERSGREVRRWQGRHHYFGGVSCVGHGGAAGDARRDGLGIVL